MARINVILIMENQNSTSPNTLTAIRFTQTSATRKHTSISHFHWLKSMPKVSKNVTKYCDTAVISVIPSSTSAIQYVQPANLPQPRPR